MSRAELRDLLLGSLAGSLSAAALVPLTQRPSSPSISFFQIGASAFTRSMISRAPGERLAAVRRRHGHDHARLARAARRPRGAPRPPRTARARPTASSAIAAHPLLRHLGVGLVLEPLDLARHAREGHDRAGARVAHALGQRVERQRLRAHAHPRRRGGRAAAHRRDQRQLVARVEHVLGVRVLAVHRHHERDAVGERRERLARERVAHPRAVGQLERQRIGAGALAQHREQAHGDLHAPDGMPRILRPPWPPSPTRSRPSPRSSAPTTRAASPTPASRSSTLYREDDVAPNLEERLGEPGDYPFTRGIHPDMYRGRTWTMRQYAGYATAAETNERFRYLIEHGSTGLSMAFDLPTQLGRDSDDPLCAGRGRPHRRGHRHDRRHAPRVRPASRSTRSRRR